MKLYILDKAGGNVDYFSNMMLYNYNVLLDMRTVKINIFKTEDNKVRKITLYRLIM